MFGLPSPHTGKRVAVADIGSGSAGVAILSIEKGKPARVLAAHRATLVLEERSSDATLAGVIAAVSESAEKAIAAEGARPGSIQRAYAIVRPPWVRSKTILARKTFPKEEKIHARMISDIAREALEAEKELDRANLIEANVVRVELNGYPTPHPEGKYAHSVQVSILATACEPRIKKAAQETLMLVSPTPPTLRSGTGALLSILRDRSAAHSDYLVVDMTSTGTAMFTVHKGTPFEHVLVPEGVHTILKRIAGDRLPEEAMTLMHMVARDHCDDAACEEIKAAMVRAEQELIKVYGEAMAKLASVRKLPNTLVLLAETDIAAWLSNFFSRIDFTQFTMTSQPFVVEILTPLDLEPLVMTKNAKKTWDVSLLVAAALVNSEQNAGHAK